jgi:hypothetical protein
MIAGLDPAKEDALHEYVEGVRRLAAQHKPRASLRRHLYDLRHAQLRRYIAKRKLDAKVRETDHFWTRWIASLGKIGRAA